MLLFLNFLLYWNFALLHYFLLDASFKCLKSWFFCYLDWILDHIWWHTHTHKFKQYFKIAHMPLVVMQLMPHFAHVHTLGCNLCLGPEGSLHLKNALCLSELWFRLVEVDCQLNICTWCPNLLIKFFTPLITFELTWNHSKCIYNLKSMFDRPWLQMFEP